jgi:hypothetical protein
MHDGIPFETPSARQNPSTRWMARVARRTLAALARNWRDTRYLHGRLLDAQRPWEQHGPLRWQHELGGWRLVGAHLSDDERAGGQKA